MSRPRTRNQPTRPGCFPTLNRYPDVDAFPAPEAHRLSRSVVRYRPLGGKLRPKLTPSTHQDNLDRLQNDKQI